MAPFSRAPGRLADLPVLLPILFLAFLSASLSAAPAPVRASALPIAAPLLAAAIPGPAFPLAAPLLASAVAAPAPSASERRPDTLFEGIPYFRHARLEGLFGKKGRWLADLRRFEIEDEKGRTWTFAVDQPYLRLGKEVLNLSFPVRRGPEHLFLPAGPLAVLLRDKAGLSGLDTLLPALLPPAAPPAPAAKPAAARADSAANGNILSVTAEEKDNGALVTVALASPLKAETFWVPPHFIVRFDKGRAPGELLGRSAGAGPVRSLELLQEKGVAQLTLRIPGPVDTVESAAEDGLFLITVRKAAAKKGKGRKDRKAAAADKAKEGKRVRTIIVDPGHGGKDPGARIGGLNEADITLAVGLKLRAELRKKGYKVLMTREKDEYKSLDERPKFASERGGDLFISLHCNSIDGSAARKRSVRGFVVYILREGESEEDKALARRENEAMAFEKTRARATEITPVDWILLEHQLNLYSKESEVLAERIVESFDGFGIGKYSTGARQAGFYVLVGAYMPAVLFEMGYMTHEGDRALMASPKGQAEIAKRLAEALDRYGDEAQTQDGPKN